MSLLLERPPVVLGDYAAGDAASCLADIGWLERTRLRRRQLQRMTAAFDLPLARQRLPDADYVISRKLDGEFACLVFEHGEAALLNPGGTVRVGLPLLAEAAERLASAGVKRAFFGGEVHAIAADGSRTRVHDVLGPVRAPGDDAALERVGFGVFNVYELDGEDLSIDYTAAMQRAQELFGGGQRIFPVEVVHGDKSAVLARFDAWVGAEDAEGLVVRSERAGVFKIKPRHTLDLAVLGYSEGLDGREGLLHSLLVGIALDDEHAQLIGRVGGGFSDEDRANLLEQLAPQAVDSDYAEVNSDRVAYRMIAPGTVLEISCLELIARTSYGSPVDRMVLEWLPKKHRWTGLRRRPLCALRSAQFLRLRHDKTFSAADCGVGQIAALIDIGDAPPGVGDDLAGPVSELLERCVATKTLKGATLVRKLVAWKTHREGSRDWPAYVLHMTDYSPSRKDPLQHEIRVSNSETQIRAMLEDWKQAKFVRGWKTV